ncbi:uncharacterized protein HMPREF1541_06480 [Cyphellophora europaea CBS 101466]|uniref:F-box domain-containing protein n=1 Tax=Cyphellophora europaea (strain CBS 101466) TaxID=1220924 RepID=W2RQ70_CYPE1|nr:uncharacterized protein HMPREF1541_06480 [Cyphellophora europaea CBS 101466]ETN38445.1 hypothetical protein HMPREF1541_06480 [Cyphellophora europaea CBS 101466]
MPDDRISTLPVLRTGPAELLALPNETLERIVSHCDPITRTLLGLANKRLGNLATKNAAGFPCIRERYGGDLERHRFMLLLDAWMNRAYTGAAGASTFTRAERNRLKERRLCYICRKYQPIAGKKCEYWNNCPKKASMPIDLASEAARQAEIDRRPRPSSASRPPPSTTTSSRRRSAKSRN